jgi:hypothetical protein
MPIGLVEQRENFFFGVSLCISANSTLGYWKFTKLAEGLNCYSRLCLSPSLSGKCRHGAMATDLGWGQKAKWKQFVSKNSKRFKLSLLKYNYQKG